MVINNLRLATCFYRFFLYFSRYKKTFKVVSNVSLQRAQRNLSTVLPFSSSHQTPERFRRTWQMCLGSFDPATADRQVGVLALLIGEAVLVVSEIVDQFFGKIRLIVYGTPTLSTKAASSAPD